MDYGPSDSSGTDDDLPSHQNRVQRAGRVARNGRSAVVGSVPYPWSSNDMEAQIHHLEQEAYCAVLRAFKAQSDAITWEKESLITELRKELRVSNEEHRELLGRVNADEVILRIREWRQAGGLQSQASHDLIPTPTFSASRKKQKTSQPIPLLSLSMPSFALHPQTVAASMQPPLLATKRGGKKPKPGQTLPGISSVKSLQYLSTGPTGRSQLATDPLIGRKVMTRWPEDNSFYEAVITDYNPVAGLHALVYDKDTANETWEWVNLKEISPEDIRWDGEDVGISHQGGRGGLGNGHRKSLGRGGAFLGAGRGRGAKAQPKKDFPPSKNGIGKKILDEIEMHQTDTLIKEVERVFGANNPDPIEVERAKKLLKDHEQTLIDAISRLADASDGESEGDARQGHSAEVWKKQQNDGNPESTNIEDSMAREDRGDGSEGDQMGREGMVASDDQRQGEDNNNNN